MRFFTRFVFVAVIFASNLFVGHGRACAEDFPVFNQRLQKIIADRDANGLARVTSADLQTSFGPDQQTIREWLETMPDGWEILGKALSSECEAYQPNSEVPVFQRICPGQFTQDEYRLVLSQIDGIWWLTSIHSGD